MYTEDKEKAGAWAPAFIIYSRLIRRYGKYTTYLDVVRAVQELRPDVPNLANKVWDMIKEAKQWTA